MAAMEEISRIRYVKTSRGSVFEGDALNDFVGVVFEHGKDKNGEIIIHYPKTLGDLPLPDQKENRKLLLALVKSLKLLKNADYESKYYDGRIENINLDKYPLFSYLWIWDDFKSHGRLIFSETTNSRNASGRINWKKTFQGTSMLHNGDIVYNDYVYRRKTEKENLLTEIYDYCVYKSLEMIFFLTNLSKNIIHPLYKDISSRRHEYINCLNEVIEATFDDEKKLRYRHMLHIVRPSSFDSLIDKQVIGVSSYAGVFEKEIDILLGNVDDISFFYPKATLIKEDGTEEALGSLRQDTINAQNSEYCIIDSKFYEFGNMPATESVEKQIVYGESLERSKGIPADNIYNVFLIPRSFEEEGWDPASIIRYHGHARADWKDHNKKYEKVLFYFIDLKYVISNYRSGYKNELFQRLRGDAMSRLAS